MFSLGMYWYIFGGIVERFFSLIHGTESTRHRSGVFGYLVGRSSTEVEDNKVLDQVVRLESFITREVSLLQLRTGLGGHFYFYSIFPYNLFHGEPIFSGITILRTNTCFKYNDDY